MKILLINPPKTTFPGSESISHGLPLGLLYVAAVLDKEGYAVEILDTLVEELETRREGDTIRYGMPVERIKEEIALRKPDIVGIASPFTSQEENTIQVADAVKQVNAEILTVTGGPHASVCTRRLLEKAGSIDMAVIGEGERTMLDIVRWQEGGKDKAEINGIAYRRDGEIVFNEARAHVSNLDDIPLPAYHLVNMEKYLSLKGMRSRQSKYSRDITMITSRGCPYDCVFCSIHTHMGRQYRPHSTEYVTNHLKHVIKNYGVKHIHFEDDNLNLDMQRFESILDAMIGDEMCLSWDTPNGIRADRLNRDILAKIKKSGCTHLIIGVESGEQHILDNIIKKSLKLESVVEAARLCRELGIQLFAFYVIGFPGEKQENMENTIKFALRLKREYDTHMLLFVATPLFGTRLHEVCVENDFLVQEITPRALAEATQYYGTGLIRTPEFGPEDIKRIVARGLSDYNRLSVLGYLKEPGKLYREVLRRPGPAITYLKSWFKVWRRS